MLQDDIIHVDYTVYASEYKIRKHIPKLLADNPTLAFDVECRSVYNKSERAEAKEYLKDTHTSDAYYKQARVVAESSGLSFPSIVKTTHFIFAANKNMSHIVICTSDAMETFLWSLIADYKGTFLVWNSLFDLKICFQRTGKMPKNYVDGMLMAKCLLNSVDIWKAKVGLKDIVGAYYPPSWAMHTDYEPTNLKDTAFIKYCSWDGSATVLAHELIRKELNDD